MRTRRVLGAGWVLLAQIFQSMHRVVICALCGSIQVQLGSVLFFCWSENPLILLSGQ